MKRIVSVVLRYPQSVVDMIGMYRMVTLALSGILLSSLLAGFFGWLPFGVLTQLQVVVPVVLLALALNYIFAKVWQVHANHESAVITALLLFFLFNPQVAFVDNWPVFAAVALGLLSKFIFVYRKQHMVNAAAMGASLSVLIVWISNVNFGTYYTTDIFQWWVSNPTLFWPVVMLGSLVVLKVRKWAPIAGFMSASVLVFLMEEYRFFGDSFSVTESLELFLFSWPAVFLALFMLTEPFSLPSTRKAQVVYGVLIGFLMHTTLFTDLIPMTPELALVIGNLVAQPFRLTQKLFLTLQSKSEIAKDTYEFIFSKPADFAFKSGQYLEWMLPHKQADGRGVRRYFTIASSPTESVVRLAIKVIENGSSYKKELMRLEPGDGIVCSQLAGDFLLPKDQSEKLGFIAGGIGVTPFSSHLRFMQDTEGVQYDTAFLYCVKSVSELAYQRDFLSYAHTMPVNYIPVVANESVEQPMEQGYITQDMLERRVPDFKERHWYISGPPVMVEAYDALLHEAGVPDAKITKDFFPGLA